MAEILPPTPESCARLAEGGAHPLALWGINCDGERVNLTDKLCAIADALPLIQTNQQKPYIEMNWQTRDTCEPAIVLYPCDGAGGYDFDNPTAYVTDPAKGGKMEIPMNQVVNTGSPAATRIDKENLSPFTIDGPAAAQPLDDIITAALGASLNTAFDLEGSAITEADIKECGSVTIMTKDGRQGIVVGGDTDNPVASWTWNGGMSGLDEVEILDGCSVWVNACAEKEYVPAKV